MADKRIGKRVYDIWLSFSIRQKLMAFAGVVILTVILAISSNLAIIHYALYGFGRIMDYNVTTSAFLDAVGEENEAFETYVRLRTEENQNIYEKACAKTSRLVWSLPFDYEMMGAARYAKTWSVRNFYPQYVKERDRFLAMGEENPDYITDLYRVYRLQEYMELYARRLMQITVQDGNDDYLAKASVLYSIPYGLAAGAVVVAGLILGFVFLMWYSLVTPLNRLAQASRKIARNEFEEADIVIENRDEMGELVAAFNKMKHATIGYIDGLEEKYEITQRLHKEEMERLEMEKNLDAARLEVLRSQINPHFLFNTLNMIACMAKLEEAQVTEKMIANMSSLFRYNLKMTDPKVTLGEEMKIVDAYMYLQQMRFGDRIRYQKDVSKEAEAAVIPSFSLQPIVENAILHGLSKKEEGGRLLIRARLNQELLVLTITDTGAGMDKKKLQRLKRDMERKSTSRLGIGIGNIHKRLQMMYEGAGFQIYSTKNAGTVIQLKIPQ